MDLRTNRTPLLNGSELAQMLSPFLTTSTTRCYLSRGKFPFKVIKICGRNYVSKREAEKYAAKLAAAASEAENENN